jgi:hypothetical protein
LFEHGLFAYDGTPYLLDDTHRQSGDWRDSDVGIRL